MSAVSGTREGQEKVVTFKNKGSPPGPVLLFRFSNLQPFLARVHFVFFIKIFTPSLPPLQSWRGLHLLI